MDNSSDDGLSDILVENYHLLHIRLTSYIFPRLSLSSVSLSLHKTEFQTFDRYGTRNYGQLQLIIERRSTKKKKKRYRNHRCWRRRDVACRCLFESHAIRSNHKVALAGCGTTRRGTAPKKCTMLCTPCPWNTTCPCGVQQMTGPTCVVPPAWVSFVLSRSGLGVPTPFLLLPRVSLSLSLPAPCPQVSTSCLDTGMDLTGIFSPPDIRLATKIGEGERTRSRATTASERVGRPEIRLRGSRARPP